MDIRCPDPRCENGIHYDPEITIECSTCGGTCTVKAKGLFKKLKVRLAWFVYDIAHKVWDIEEWLERRYYPDFEGDIPVTVPQKIGHWIFDFAIDIRELACKIDDQVRY